jgi:hypothetical protein
LRADVPPELEHVVHRALAKKREERYQSMAEFAEALRPFAAFNEAPRLTESGVSFARPPTPNGWEQQKKDTLRTRTRIANSKVLAAAGIAAIAIVGVLSYVLSPNRATTSKITLTQLRPAAPARTSEVTEEKPAVPNDQTASPQSSPKAPAIAKVNQSKESQVAKPPAPAERGSRLAPTAPIELPKVRTAKPAEPSAQPVATRSAVKANARQTVREPAQPAQPVREAKTRVEAVSQPETKANKDQPASSTPSSAVSPPNAARTGATRTVTINNPLRTAVTVTLTCGAASKSATVSGLRHASVAVPQENCTVSCSGAGEPVCPAQLNASTNAFAIR